MFTMENNNNSNNSNKQKKEFMMNNNNNNIINVRFLRHIAPTFFYNERKQKTFYNPILDSNKFSFEEMRNSKVQNYCKV